MSQHPPYAASAIDDLPDKWDGFTRLVQRGLGLTAFGANVMNIPPNFTTRSHDESESGQQEMYIGLSGSGWVIVNEDERLLCDPEHIVRVDAGVPRTLSGGPDGARILCIGATPGQAYEPPDWTAPES